MVTVANYDDHLYYGNLWVSFRQAYADEKFLNNPATG